jgi:hypothetical protein
MRTSATRSTKRKESRRRHRIRSDFSRSMSLVTRTYTVTASEALGVWTADVHTQHPPTFLTQINSLKRLNDLGQLYI